MVPIDHCQEFCESSAELLSFATSVLHGELVLREHLSYIMSREAGPSIVEADFVLQALKAGVRLDGRSALQSRDVELIPYEDRVECALGDTRCATP